MQRNLSAASSNGSTMPGKLFNVPKAAFLEEEAKLKRRREKTISRRTRQVF
jgi:hypothetical protein